MDLTRARAAFPVAARIFAEQQARLNRIRAMCFPKQRAFIDDRSRLKAALCTRRAGKSTAAGIMITEGMEEMPGSSSLVIGLTRESIKRIYWKDVFFRIRDEAGVPLKPNYSDLSIRHENGSVCYFVGVDSTEDEKRKILGQKFWRVVVDESSEYTIDLRELVYQTLRPATSDYRGTIAMVGTPGEILGTLDKPQLFYGITSGRERGWSVHRWSALDNPHQAEQHREELEDIERDRPQFKETTQYRTHYLGEWPETSDRLVYRYAPANAVEAAPACEDFCIGIDLGYTDDTAFTVGGWRRHDPTLYLLSSVKRPSMNFDEVAQEIRRLRVAYPNARLVIDGANKQGVEHMRSVYRLPLVAAEKQGKRDHIRLMNADLQMQRIKVVRDQCAGLIDEWRALPWDDEWQAKEHEGFPNHLADSALYLWRASRHYLAEPAPAPKPKQDSEAFMDEQMERRFGRGSDDDDY